jgi:hypothetical protein
MDLLWLIRSAFAKVPPQLEHGEEILWERRACRSTERSQQGGVLYLTDRRLLFVPSSHDAERGAVPASMPRHRIARLAVEPRTLNPLLFFTGGFRRRLRVEEPNGWARVFLIGKLDRVIAELRAHGVGVAGPAAQTGAGPEGTPEVAPEA